MNEWSLDVKTSKGVTSTSGVLTTDEYSKLATRMISRGQPGGLQEPAQHARVSFSYTLGVEFGTEKVAATVTLNCNQDEPTINRAGELAFTKAVELVNDAWGELQRGRAT